MLRVLIPRIIDESNLNAQVLNIKSLIKYGVFSRLSLIVPYYDRLDVAARMATTVKPFRLWRWRFWHWHLFFRLQGSVDALLYPTADAEADYGWRFRDFCGRRIPVIATLEGLVGNDERASQLSQWAGHRVNCQHLDDALLKRCDRLLHRADHIVAISPFLLAMGEKLYGKKISYLPLGVDLANFYPSAAMKSGRVKVVGAGRLYENKRPQLFISMAKQFPDVDFVWYGEGELRAALISRKTSLNLNNIEFPGSKTPEELAEAFRQADLFILPSLSEGVPKVTQEAAACGLPVILFGFYEAPTVIHGRNGLVVWDDDELLHAVTTLVTDRELLRRMGQESAGMAKDWGWNEVAPQWREKIHEVIATGKSR